MRNAGQSDRRGVTSSSRLQSFDDVTGFAAIGYRKEEIARREVGCDVITAIIALRKKAELRGGSERIERELSKKRISYRRKAKGSS